MRHVGIALAVDQADRAGERYVLVEHSVGLAVPPESGMGRGGIVSVGILVEYGLARGETRWVPYVIAVVPSLLAWAALTAGLLALIPTALSLGIVAAALLASPLADRAVSMTYRAAPGWRRLRTILSTGLGALTLVLAAL